MSGSFNFDDRSYLILATAGVRRHSITHKPGHLSSCDGRDCLCEVVVLHESDALLLLRSRLLVHKDGRELVEKLSKELAFAKGLSRADFEDCVGAW